MNTLISELSAAALPAVVAGLGSILAIIINRAAGVAQVRWGIEIEARHREALHSALMSGVRSALSAGVSGPGVIVAATAYAEASVPDAIRALKPTPDVLKAIAESKFREDLRNG